MNFVVKVYANAIISELEYEKLIQISYKRCFYRIIDTGKGSGWRLLSNRNNLP